ncbi:MAG: hypothetical protein ACW98D_19170 [Promethearchaeota archaeon]|jgi:hypothetical protein
MLEANLDLIKVKGTRLPNLDLDALTKEYYIGAYIRAIPDKIDSNQDVGRVFTIKPEVDPINVDGHQHDRVFRSRGYFAYGRTEGDDVVFEIYIPYASGKGKKWPPNTLDTATALFALRLIRDGYGINAHDVEFTSREGWESRLRK